MCFQNVPLLSYFLAHDIHIFDQLWTESTRWHLKKAPNKVLNSLDPVDLSSLASSILIFSLPSCFFVFGWHGRCLQRFWSGGTQIHQNYDSSFKGVLRLEIVFGNGYEKWVLGCVLEAENLDLDRILCVVCDVLIYFVWFCVYFEFCKFFREKIHFSFPKTWKNAYLY